MQMKARPNCLALFKGASHVGHIEAGGDFGVRKENKCCFFVTYIYVRNVYIFFIFIDIYIC